MNHEQHKLDKYLGKLWRHRDFRTLWFSLTITHFGGQITFLALPLTAALLLNAGPVEMGYLIACEALPYTVFGLFVGVLIDRSKKLPLIVAADLGRGAVLLMIPVAAWFHVLTMPILYLVGFLVGLGGIVGWAAYQVFMAERIGPENLVEANSRMALSDSAAQLIGPGLAGAIIHWLTAPFAILLDACSFFASAWMLKGIPPKASDAPKIRTDNTSWASIKADIKEGMHMIRDHAVLRSIAISLLIWNFLKHAYLAIVFLFAARDLNLSAGSIGGLFTMAGLGFLLASASCQPLNRRFGVGCVMLTGMTLSGVSWLAIAFVQAGQWATLQMGATLFVFDLGTMLFFINYLSLRQAVTPDHLRGRVTSTLIFVAVSMAPVGSIVGGYLGEWIGLRRTVGLCGVVGVVLGGLLLRYSPLMQMRKLPENATAAPPTPEMAAD
ncbi:MAG: MFS transporter [Betaproteobacteria bacterium]|nr:MFS transporter [Betaproteobacteria bacterium]